MAEYIEREAAIRCCTFGRTSLGLIEELRRLPSTDVVEVRHGRWVEDGEICGIYKYKCSLCGGEVGGLLDNTKYCCFCGARMDGGTDYDS